MAMRDTSGNLLWSNIPGLSTLELQFETRKKMDESSTITVQPQALADMRQELLCPICLDVMENVMVAKCLHRYCKDCIDKHLRQVDQKRECPLCRIHLATNRSLRKDDAMDAIVNLLYARKSRDKKRHRDNDDHCPEVSVVRDGARRHREQVTLMREKQRVRLLSMEAAQRTKAQQESAFRREERRDQLLPIVPVVPAVPNMNTPLPLPLPLPVPIPLPSATASSSATSSNSNKIVINNSTTATTTTASAAAAVSGDLKVDIDQNLNGKSTEEYSLTNNTERRNDEKIEWAEMKTAEEVEVQYEILKNVPQNKYSSRAIEHSDENTEYSGIKDPRSFNNENKLSYSAAKVKDLEEDDICDDRKIQNSKNPSCVPIISVGCSDLLSTNISHSNSITNENNGKENECHVNGNDVITVVPVSTVNSNNHQTDRNFIISNNNCQIGENGCIKIAEFDNNHDNDNKINYKNGNNSRNGNHNNGSSRDCSSESDCNDNVDFDAENDNGNNYCDENNENNGNNGNNANDNTGEKEGEQRIALKAHDNNHKNTYNGNNSSNDSNNNNINKDKNNYNGNYSNNDSNSNNHDNNDNNNNMQCNSENMIVEDTRSGVTSVDSSDDQEEDESNESTRKLDKENKNIVSKLILQENNNVHKCVKSRNDDIENQINHNSVNENINEDKNGNIDDNDNNNEDGSEVEVEIIQTIKSSINLDFQKRVFALKKHENGNFSLAQKDFFSITVKRHGEEFQLPKIENTVFETFDNEKSAAVGDVKDYLLHQFSLLNITTLDTTSMSLSRNMIILSMILPSENKNDQNDKNSAVEEFKLSFDGTLTWQIARLLREKGLQLAIFYQLDTNFKSLSSSSSSSLKS